MKRLIAVTAASLVMAAHAQAPKVDQSALRDALSSKLKDSESARFKDLEVTAHKDLWRVCGQINAKNAFGAYAGFQPLVAYAVQGRPGTPLKTFPLTEIGEIAATMCAQ